MRDISPASCSNYQHPIFTSCVTPQCRSIREQPDPILPTRLSIKVTTKDPDEESDKATRQTERAPLQELLSSTEEPQAPEDPPVNVKPERKEERADEAITLPQVPKSPQNQRRVRKPGPKTEDGPVTDEELEELEAKMPGSSSY